MAETFHDQPSAEAPVRWSPASGLEPDSWLSMDDACGRLLRIEGWDPRDTEAHLRAGTVLHTVFATYQMEPDR